MLGTITIPDRRLHEYATGILLGIALGAALVTSAWLLHGEREPEHQHRRSPDKTANA